MAAKSPLYDRFKTDQDKEESGVWTNFGGGDPDANPPVPDIKVRIRRLKSKASIEARRELDKPHTNEIRRGALSNDLLEDLLLKQLSRGVIADWSGITDENGTPLNYSPDNAYRILKDLPDFRDEIIAIAMAADAFKDDVDKTTEANLSNS